MTAKQFVVHKKIVKEQQFVGRALPHHPHHDSFCKQDAYLHAKFVNIASLQINIFIAQSYIVNIFFGTKQFLQVHSHRQFFQRHQWGPTVRVLNLISFKSFRPGMFIKIQSAFYE